LPQDLAALVRRERAPLRIALLSGLERAIQIFGARVRYFAEGFARGGTDDGLALALPFRDPLTGDEQFQIGIRLGARSGV